MRNKLISSAEAVALVKSGDTVAVQGFMGFSHPEELSVMLEKRFVETGEPRDLTYVYAAAQGDGKERGANHYAHEGLVKRVIGGHFNLAPKLGKLITENKLEAYNLPQGTIIHLFRAIAGRKPGVITHVGLKTFVDPRVEGGKLNDITTEDIVKVIDVNGREYLHYLPMKIDVAFIRGTTADEKGNVTMEKEAVLLEAFHIAQAAKASGGIVIVQVERMAATGTLPPQSIKVPGLLVDYVIVAQPENHWQTNEVYFDPSFCCEIRRPLGSLPQMPLNERKVIARRGAMELTADAAVNLGIGVPDGVATVANEEGMLDSINLTLEAGPIGGVAASGTNFGAAYNPEVVLEQPNQFDFYDGGGLDIAYLGMAETDEAGNINVSKFGTRVAGCGGFVNITQNAKKVVFCGTLTAGGLEVAVGDGKLTIVKEGKSKKFVKKVGQITFSGEYARAVGQKVLYVTERAVFELTPDGLLLIEVAPGVDLKTQVLDQVEFDVKVSENLKAMDPRFFMDQTMGIKDEVLIRD